MTTLRYYYIRLDNGLQFLIVLATLTIIVPNYAFLIILIVLNVLIYVELRKMLENKRRIIGKWLTVNRKRRIRAEGTSNQEEGPVVASATTASITPIQVLPYLPMQRENREKESLKRSLIMTLWVSILFSSDRLIKCVYRTIVFINSNSRLAYYLNAFSFFFDLIVYSSFFIVYMRTNKMFNKKFYQIFRIKRRNNQL